MSALTDPYAGLETSLRALTAIPALSGFEDAMILAVRAELEGLGYAVEVDALGNVAARLAAREMPARPVVLLLAHMDELGLLVRKIEPAGFLRCERVGGVPERVLPGLTMLVGTRDGGSVEAIVGTKAHHLTEQDERYHVARATEIYLDAGFHDRAEALAAGVQPGSPVVYGRRFVRRGSRVFAPALDNRAGCAILLELAARLRDSPVACAPWLIFSVQEEFSLRGVLPTARRLKPDVALAVDIAVACDTPDLDRTEVRLGGGPALGAYSFHGRGTLAGVIPNPRLLRYMESAAEQSGLPVQRNVFFGGLTDGSYVQLENEGIPTIDVGFPTRYTHSAMECCDLADLLATVALLEAALRAMPVDLDLRRGLPI